MHEREQQIALHLLREHPGWSDTRVAIEMRRLGEQASPSGVRVWRTGAGLAPMTKDVERWPPPRRAAVALRCGHFAHPGDARCRHCR